MYFTKKFSFLAILLLFCAFHCNPIIGAQSAEVAREEFNPSKVAAIQILPFRDDPRSVQPQSPGFSSAAAASPALDQPQLKYYRPYSTSRGAPNDYGFGKTFCYLSQEEVKAQDRDATLLPYMNQVFNYHTSFNAKQGDKKSDKRNVLLVRMRVTAAVLSSAGDKSGTSPPESFEYILGVFVSGAQEDYRCGEIRNLTVVRSEFPDPIKNSLECQGFLDLWNSNSGNIREHLREFSLIDDSAPVPLTLVEADRLLSVEVYKTPHVFWKIGPKNKKFVPMANPGSLDDIGNDVLTRLGFIIDKPDKKKPKFKTERDRYESEIRGSQEAMARSELTYKLYGKPCYTEIGDDKPCFGKDGNCGLYFNQSEQAFISWLEQAGYFGNDVNNSPNCYSKKPLIPGLRYSVSKIELDLFSFLDICRFCRGTMSYMMSNGKMNDTLSTFFKHLKLDERDEGSVTFAPNYETKIAAFSYEKTDI